MMVRMNTWIIGSLFSSMLVVRLSNRLEDLQIKRRELEAHRISIVSQIQQLQIQITSRRKEGTDGREYLLPR